MSYDTNLIDDIKVDYLYIKTLTNIVKQIKFDLNINETYTLCSLYFKENKLLNIELDNSIKNEIKKHATKLSEDVMFLYNIRQYCERTSSLETKKLILSKAFAIMNTNDLNSKINTVYENLNTEEIKSIAYDVIYSSYVVN